MEERIYDYWVATLQDGYIGRLTDITEAAGGARAMYYMDEKQLESVPGISGRLSKYIMGQKRDIRRVEEEYCRLGEKGISYVNHTDNGFPKRLQKIASPPYGLFVRGKLPDELTASVAIIGARECTEYGRFMAEYFADRLGRRGIQIISGMAWGIDGIAQAAAVAAGGRSYAVMGCGVDIIYPSKNRPLYNRLCENGNGVISEYAPGTAAEARRFPPRNRIIAGLCDVLLVVEARAKSGTFITVDMAVEQGKTVMIVPGRLTDHLSAGCLNLLYQGALPATSLEAVLEQLGIDSVSDRHKKSRANHEEIKITPVVTEADSIKRKKISGARSQTGRIAGILTLDPKSVEEISDEAEIPIEEAMADLTGLELAGTAKEVSPGYFIKMPEFV